MSVTNNCNSFNWGNGLRLVLNEENVQKIRMLPMGYYLSGKISIDSTEEWNRKASYIPSNGEIVIYNDFTIIEGIKYPGIKVGDGMAYVVDLPFFGNAEIDQFVQVLYEHIDNSQVHVLPSDKEFWDSKVDVELNGESLIFTRERKGD